MNIFDSRATYNQERDSGTEILPGGGSKSPRIFDFSGFLRVHHRILLATTMKHFRPVFSATRLEPDEARRGRPTLSPVAENLLDHRVFCGEYSCLCGE